MKITRTRLVKEEKTDTIEGTTFRYKGKYRGYFQYIIILNEDPISIMVIDSSEHTPEIGIWEWLPDFFTKQDIGEIFEPCIPDDVWEAYDHVLAHFDKLRSLHEHKESSEDTPV